MDAKKGTFTINLNKRSVESLTTKSKRYFAWDMALKGFGVRAEPSGRKSFLCRYRHAGARRQYLLGTFGPVTVEEARSEVRRVLSASALGKDVAQSRYEARRALRFAELVELFLAEHVSKLKSGTYTEYEGAFRKHAIPALGRTPADAVTTSELNRLQNQMIAYPSEITNAIRLLLFIGCRLREILHLRWTDVDFERGLLHLPDSKTGKKTVVLNPAAINILKDTPKRGFCVIPGEIRGQARHDLQHPWEHIHRAAGLQDVRLHDLRHTHPSFGVMSGLGLPIIGRLLGHSSPLTTARYAHLADDPVRKASDLIGSKLSQLVG
jgi:integrase